MASDPAPHQGTQSVVFDAEPIIIWVDNDPGAKTVEHHLSEVHYNCADRSGRAYGRKKTQQLQQFGVQVINTNATWEQAAIFKDEYRPNFPLGDAFALATAAEQGVPLLVGDDKHWNDPENDGHDIIRVS
ncbi:MAG TPA: PIN domain-containing protein [Halococcus sp.]|nr:PIN domain-containing protein [Halococcus sp.]